MGPQEEKKPVRFLGRYRSGLTRKDAAFYMRVVRALFRSCGAQGEGALANRLRENLGSQAWNECMTRLSEWDVIAFEPARHGRARLVALTASGRGCAIEFCDDAQFAEQEQSAIESEHSAAAEETQAQ